MDNKPVNLIELFEQRLARQQSLFQTNVSQTDMSSMSSIPSLYTFAMATLNVQGGIEAHRREDELMRHVDLVNGVSPTAKALSHLKRLGAVTDPEAVDRLLTPPPVRNSPVDITAQQLMEEDLAKLFNQPVRTPAGYRQANMLDGLVPTVIGKAGWGSSPDVVKIIDLFQVNREAFLEPRNEFIQAVGLGDDHQLELNFTLNKGGSSNDLRWTVEALIIDRKSLGHWKVRTTFDVMYNGEINITPYKYSHSTAHLNQNVAFMRLLGGHSAVSTPHDIAIPSNYVNREYLSPAVEVYNELENVIHFGTENLIPWDAVRAGLREFMYANKYYPVVPEFLTNDQIAQKFADMYWSDDKKEGSFVHFKKRVHGEFAQLSLYFRHEVGSEKIGNGILEVNFEYYRSKNLLDLDTVPELQTYSSDNRNGSSIELRVHCQEGQAPKLLPLTNAHCTQRTLNTLLDVAVAMRERAKTAREAG